MAEDSGAFKTNRAASAQFRHFMMVREHRCNQASPAGETYSGIEAGIRAADF
jgi:hypothetical protein